MALALGGSAVVNADTGGPDAAGYRFIDSNESGGPAYDFEDISGTGTRINGLQDDNMVGPFALGFTFEYYGTDYTQVYMSSNCFLTVLAGQSNGCCSSEPIPDTGNPNGIIAGWYEDVDPRVGDVYYQTLGTAPNRRFIVQWSAVKLFGFPDTITLQYKLFESDDSLEVHYQQAVTAGEVYAAGIENQDGSIGLQYYRGSADLSTPLAVKYYLNPAVLSIARANASPTNAPALDYTVTFSEDVTGVDVSDFALTTTGLSGTSISLVTPVSASVYTVTVDTGTGDGTLRLDLDDDDSITSSATGTELGGAGVDNGDFCGETYTMDRTGPQADAINRLDANPTDAAQVDFIVEFDEAVDGVGTADFDTSTTGSLAGTSVDSVSPAFGNALDLSNNPEVGGKHLNLGSDASLQLSALTLEAWVCYQKDGAETIVAKGNGAGDASTDYILQVNKDGAGKLNLFAAGAWQSSTTAVSPNTWTHVAVTYDGADKKFYINGTLDNTEPHAGTIAQNTLSAYVGRQGESTDAGHYDGLIDEVRIWNVVREQPDIETTMNSTLMGDEAGLVGYWRFDQFQDLGAGAAGTNDIEDCSPNSNHGDAVSSPTLATSNYSGLAPDYIARVNTGTGAGTLGLNLDDDDSITDEAGNPFGGAGSQDYTAGQTYTIDRPEAPTVTTAAVSDITTTTASCGGNVTADGGEAVTARGICWSTSENPTTDDDKTTDGTGTGEFTSEITGLTANTTYHVRAYAANPLGTGYGADVEFTTDTTPTVTTAEVTDVTNTAATCGGNVTTDGGADVTGRGVCWSALENPTVDDDKTEDGTGTGEFTSAITDLSPGTTYHVRAYATNSVGISYGADIEFTTGTTPATIPTVVTAAVSSVTASTASSGGNVTADGGADVTARGVCWSTSENPTVDDDKTEDGTGTGEFTSAITGLSPGTTYHVRAYATNSAGTAYGDDVTFTTSAAEPTPDPEPDLRLRIDVPTQEVHVGDELTLRVDVWNLGDADATAVVLRLPLPPGTEFIGVGLITGPSGQSAPLNAYVDDGEVVVELGTVAASEHLELELVLEAKASGTIAVQASVSSAEQPTPATARANSNVEVDDVYWEVVNTIVPVRACGWLGIAPAFVLCGLVGMKRHRWRYSGRGSRRT
jgi:uncharacterized repeat protein (TIGR01451 family)